MEKLLAKLRRIQSLHERASTEGEKQAAAQAMRKIVDKMFTLREKKCSPSEYVFPQFDRVQR